jgi:hypothetical protein
MFSEENLSDKYFYNKFFEDYFPKDKFTADA